jgi:hypothetical protein
MLITRINGTTHFYLILIILILNNVTEGSSGKVGLTIKTAKMLQLGGIFIVLSFCSVQKYIFVR